MSAQTNAEMWMRKADHDRLANRNNMSAEQVPWDVVCFHAQQAVEKMLKAYLVQNGRPVPRTHDLVALLKLCLSSEAKVAACAEPCRFLTVFAVASRYPDDLLDPGEAEGRKAVRLCDEVCAAVQEHIDADEI